MKCVFETVKNNERRGQTAHILLQLLYFLIKCVDDTVFRKDKSLHWVPKLIVVYTFPGLEDFLFAISFARRVFFIGNV